jgi:hypothetical protein
MFQLQAPLGSQFCLLNIFILLLLFGFNFLTDWLSLGPGLWLALREASQGPPDANQDILSRWQA